MDFHGRVALVTGASVGIGRATALELAEFGAKLVLLDLNMEKLELVKKEIEVYTKDVLIYNCDVSDEKLVHEVVDDAIAKLGKIDILVNNAALWRGWSDFVDSNSDDWRRFFDINVLGTFYVTQAVLPSMLGQQYGRIINVASVAGVYGNARMACYSATKGAVISFSKALAKEVTHKGILVNAVSPGSVSPAENDDVNYTEPSNLAFIGRSGSDRENANLICFLASEEASYISCQNIQIDGCRRKQ
ncbi:MAG: SDR family oxidoreductase [Clostridia bacterium]|nr:SDR family oxidoreductase [Clostridia bacterium]